MAKLKVHVWEEDDGWHLARDEDQFEDLIEEKIGHAFRDISEETCFSSRDEAIETWNKLAKAFASVMTKVEFKGGKP